jgi:hypothetical protein
MANFDPSAAIDFIKEISKRTFDESGYGAGVYDAIKNYNSFEKEKNEQQKKQYFDKFATDVISILSGVR